MVAQSLHALHFRLLDPAAKHSAVCYVIQHVNDVTPGDDVTETDSWIRRTVNVPLQLTEYRRKPSATDVSIIY